MMKDPTEFRKRFAAWKSGKNPYSAGMIIDAIYQNNPKEEFLGEPAHHYDFTQSEEWADAHGYYKDTRGHRDDRVKKPAHPSHPSRGNWNGDKFVLTEKGIQDPNYIFFGLNDGGQDPQAILTHDGGVVLPEITVTPKGNYIYNPYDNIKLHLPKHKNGKLPGYEDGTEPVDQNRLNARLLIENAILLSQNTTFGKRKLSPESYYFRYRNSEGFRKRFDAGYGEDGAFYRLGIDLKKMPVVKEDNMNSGSSYIPNLNLVYMGDNTNLYYANLGILNRNFVKAHELSHSIYNDTVFGENNKEMYGRPVGQYLDLGGQNKLNYRHWVDENNQENKVDFSHDQNGNEGGADVGALGWLLYNEGVFNRMDPNSKITTDQLNLFYNDYKAKHPDAPYLRPIENYGTEKAAWLLNNTASVLKKPTNGLLHAKNGKLPGYADGKIHIKPANRGKFTALKKRTGHSASWFKENGTPAQKKMAVFALNAKKWHHANGKLPEYRGGKQPKGDGTRYLWDDQTQSWDRYTGDENGSVFADIVVTPRGAAHKKDAQPVQIVTPDQEEYVRKNLPIVSTNSTWHYTPAASTFVGRAVLAAGGDWKSADIASAGASLHPLLSVPLGVMDTGYNLNQSLHDLTDANKHVNTALSAASILPLVGGIKLLKGKDVGTKLLNAYNNYMYSLGNVDDINNTLRNIKYLDSAVDATPAIKASAENPFKYGGDALKTMDLFNKMRSILIRAKLSQIRPQLPDLVNDPYGIRDLANDVIHHEGMPEGVEDIFRYQILPRTNISKMNYDNTIDVLSRYGYNTLDDYNWAKYVDDDLGGYLDNSTLAIALREPHIRYAAPHEFRHRMQHLVKDKPSLAIDRKSYLDDAYGDDFVNLPNTVDESDHLFGYPHMADEAATTNLDSRIYAFSNFTDNPNIGKMSLVELNKFLDSLSDDLIIEAVANSNGYGRRYIHFLEKKYDMLNNPKTNARWANKFRNAMKYYGMVAIPTTITASAMLKPRQNEITE